MAQFKHLSLSERISIQSMLSQNGLSAIARELGRDRKTIVADPRIVPLSLLKADFQNNCTKVSDPSL